MYDIIWNCNRCDIIGTAKSTTMCPCPRGGCEAYEIKAPKKKFTRKEVLYIIKSISEQHPESLIDDVIPNIKSERELWNFNDYEKTHRMEGTFKTDSPYFFSKGDPVFIINGRRYSQNEESPKFLI